MPEQPVHIDMQPPPTSRMLGAWMSTAMVMGYMIGSAIFLLPATLAPYGANSLIAWGITVGGTMCLALALSRLAARDPGGPQSYMREAFGPTAAYYIMWMYWVSVFTSTAGIAVAFGGAVTATFPGIIGPSWVAPLSICAIFAVAAINLRGVHSAGEFQVVTTAIKLLPLLAVMVVLAIHVGSGRPTEPLAPVPIGVTPIATASALILFSLVGFEAATVAARKTRDPERTVPLATLAGTGTTGLLYFLSCTAAMLLLSYTVATRSTSPFADAIAPTVGAAAGHIVAALTAVSAIGALNASVLIQGEIGQQLAQTGDLPRVMASGNSRLAPTTALIVTSVISALFVGFNASKSFVGLYVFIILISTVASLVFYASGAVAALKLKRGSMSQLLIVIGLIYAVWTFYGAGFDATAWALALLVAGWPVRFISRWLNGSSRLGEASPAAPQE
jgi:basic amino acid/polyamine antiporter, APA family